MSSLLEQAIIDAKTLKETARRNAEAAILEQYSEEIKQSMQALLEQDDPAVGDTTGADLGATASPETPAPGTPKGPSATERIMKKIEPAYLNEDGLQEIEINLDSLVEKVSKLEEEVVDEKKVVPQGNISVMPREPSAGSYVEEDTLEETVELGEDILGEVDDAAAAAEQAKFDAEAAKKKKEAAESEAKGKEAAKKSAEEKKKAEEEAKRASTNTAAAAGVTASPMEESYELDEELVMDMSNVSKGGIDANEIELKKQKDIRDALIAQNAELEEEKESLEETLNAAIMQLEQTKEKLKKSVSVNAELKEGIQYLSEKMKDINLLNARLLYTNRTLGNSSLNERQKNQIAESISRASSVEEAKTIYETLQKSTSNVTERRNVPQSLTEAINRAPSPFLPRSNKPQADSTTDRWKLLAGIKK